MIRHVVLFKVREDVSSQVISAIFAELAAMEKMISGMSNFCGSANVNSDGFTRGYTHGFSIDFRDEKSRDTYHEHEAHKAAGSKLIATLKDGLDGLLVFDLVM